MRLGRVGYENIVGVLAAEAIGRRAPGLALESASRVSVDSLAGAGRRVLDVRRDREWDEGHVAGATHIPLARLRERFGELDRGVEWVTICASGYRSSIASSVLRREGFTVADAEGGMDAWRRAGLPVERGAPATA